MWLRAFASLPRLGTGKENFVEQNKSFETSRHGFADGQTEKRR